jgi:hypothetical protein
MLLLHNSADFDRLFLPKWVLQLSNTCILFIRNIVRSDISMTCSTLKAINLVQHPYSEHNKTLICVTL